MLLETVPNVNAPFQPLMQSPADEDFNHQGVTMTFEISMSNSFAPYCLRSGLEFQQFDRDYVWTGVAFGKYTQMMLHSA